MIAHVFLIVASCLALTRAELLERFKAPVVTQADGLVKVYASCPEDMRREYQSPVARYAADTVELLYRGLSMKPISFERAGLVITLGDVRTNCTDVIATVSTNWQGVVSRIRLPAPGYSDLGRLRIEIVKGFYRAVRGEELSDAATIAAYRQARPDLRILDERQKLETWLANGGGVTNDEEGLKLVRRIYEPGVASRRDVLIFASRLFLYPAQCDLRFLGKYRRLTFREAIEFGRIDLATRLAAYRKSKELPFWAGGRGDDLKLAAEAYQRVLLELAAGKKSEEDLLELLELADMKLNWAMEKAK